MVAALFNPFSTALHPASFPSPEQAEEKYALASVRHPSVDLRDVFVLAAFESYDFRALPLNFVSGLLLACVFACVYIQRETGREVPTDFISGHRSQAHFFKILC